MRMNLIFNVQNVKKRYAKNAYLTFMVQKSVLKINRAFKTGSVKKVRLKLQIVLSVIR